MASENSSASSGGIGFFGLLAIVFITLKLTGVIAWSWWWVTAPLWGGFAIAGLILLAITLWHVPKIIAALISDIKRARRNRA